VLGGAPTYVLTDNEKTVTTMHIAGIPVRNTQMVSFARFYAVTVLTCQPVDPATKGGVEASVKLAKADIVPTDANLRPAYSSWDELESACQEFMDEINGKVHQVTKRRPVEALAEERARFHPVPERAHTVAFGLTRRVPENTPMVSFENGQYSVPYRLAGQEVFVTTHGAGSGEEVVIVHVGDNGPIEVARHRRARPGSPQLQPEHFPDTATRVPGQYMLRPRTHEEREFLGIGHGAAAWLAEAAASATRIRSKMARAIDLAGLHGAEVVDEALVVAAAYGRFEPDAVALIIATRASGTPPRTASEDLSLAQGTRGWAAITEPTNPDHEESL
ncbi:MAG: Mu transposase domain-containing protein, partial [Pseudonocardiaceae bacterium]